MFGTHVRLILGWSDEQLTLTVDRLAHLLPATTTPAMQLAIAACAKSVVAEKLRTGSGVRYARAKDPYRVPDRYRNGDPRQTWHYVTRSMDLLFEQGLIEQRLGQWFPGARGLQTVAWANDDLMNLLGPLVDAGELRAQLGPEEVIILRDRNDKDQIDYADTPATNGMRQDVQTVNDALSRLGLYLGREKVSIPTGRRVFNGSFGRGGRFYCHGNSFQNMPATRRRELEVLICGEQHPMVEIDFSNLHIEMAYREKRRRMRPGDQYAIKGFDRTLVKVAVNVLLNATTNRAAVLAISEALFTGELTPTDVPRGETRKSYQALAESVVKAISRKHWRIADYFGSDCGARFQRRDSDMAMQIMLKMIQRTGRCPLPVHDSFLVADIDEIALTETMREVAHRYKLHPTLKIFRPGEPTSLSCMEVTAPELGKQGQHSGGEFALIGAGHGAGASREGLLRETQTAALHHSHDPPSVSPWSRGRAPSNSKWAVIPTESQLLLIDAEKAS